MKFEFDEAKSQWLFRILYADFAGLKEFSELSAWSHSPKMFVVNIYIQDPIEPSQSNQEKHNIDFVNAQQLWADPDRIEIPARTEDEPRFLVIGKIN